MDTKKQDSHLPEYALVERQEMMRGIGYGDEALERLQIGVVSSWGEINPAAINLDRVVSAVKAGVWAAGGYFRHVHTIITFGAVTRRKL